MLEIIIVMFVSASLGVLIASLCAASKSADNELLKIYENEKNKANAKGTGAYGTGAKGTGAHGTGEVI